MAVWNKREEQLENLQLPNEHVYRKLSCIDVWWTITINRKKFTNFLFNTENEAKIKNRQIISTNERKSSSYIIRSVTYVHEE